MKPCYMTCKAHAEKWIPPRLDSYLRSMTVLHISPTAMRSVTVAVMHHFDTARKLAVYTAAH